MSNPVARRLRRIGMFGLVTALASAVPLSAAGQQGEWRAYAADKASTKYSPLDQVDAESVHDLRVAWRQSTIPDATRQGNAMDAPGGSQNTPLMAGRAALHQHGPGHGGGARRRHRRGRLVRRSAGPRGRGDRPQLCDPRAGLLDRRRRTRASSPSLESRLVALDAKTGARYPDFGNGGAGGSDAGLRRSDRRQLPLALGAAGGQRRHRSRIADRRHHEPHHAGPQGDAAGRRARVRRADGASNSGSSTPSRAKGSRETRHGSRR